MVGYVIAEGGSFEESTDISDDQHLVQVASPNQSDRFTRYPKVSQGDWSGGERQPLYTDATKYYFSAGLETANPGHLRLIGRYDQVGWPASVGDMQTQAGAISADALYFYVLAKGGPNGNFVSISASNPATQAVGNYGGSVGIGLQEIVKSGDQHYITTVGTSIFAQTNTTPATTDQVYVGTSGRCMAYFENAVYYLRNGIGQGAPLYYITPPFPVSGSGTQVRVGPPLETAFQCIGAHPQGIITVSGGANMGEFYVHLWNGANLVYLGHIQGIPIDIREAGGSTYILCGAGPLNWPGAPPIIYQVSGTSLSVYDDYRRVAPDFLPAVGIAGQPIGRLDTDGTYLYLAWPGMGIRRYDLGTKAIVNVGNLNTPFRGANIQLVSISYATRTMMEAIPGVGQANNWLSELRYNLPAAPFQQGYLDFSLWDFSTPRVTKQFRSIEVELNGPLPAGAQVKLYYTLGGQSSINQVTPVVADPTGVYLSAALPAGLKGYSIQPHVVLVANGQGQGPDIRVLAVKASLGRTWKTILSCARRQQTRQQMDDTQGAFIPGMGPAQALVANLVNAYRLAGGACWLYIPDSTAPGGVATVPATVEDYRRINPSGMSPALRQDEDGIPDMEAQVELTLVEQL